MLKVKGRKERWAGRNKEAEYRIRSAAMLLFHISQKITSTNAVHFSKLYYQTKYEESM
jgi:hypothetical protein